eukprot:6185086-Pleurochrysis_carterae.AAC.1
MLRMTTAIGSPSQIEPPRQGAINLYRRKLSAIGHPLELDLQLAGGARVTVSSEERPPARLRLEHSIWAEELAI